MNPGNIWSLAENGEVELLRDAIKRLPACVDVCGWSYDKIGSRRGIVELQRAGGSQKRKWEINSNSTAFAAPILFYAVAGCHPQTVKLILSSGADPTMALHGTTPTTLAKALRKSEAATAIGAYLQGAIDRQNNPLMAMESDEEHLRSEVERMEAEGRSSIIRAEKCGTADVSVEIRGFGFEKAIHVVNYPRSGSFANFRSKVEAITRCRVVLSFQCPVNAAGRGSRTAKTSMSAVEITPRTFSRFISSTHCSCIARPVTYAVGEEDSSVGVNKTRIAKAIKEYELSPQRSFSRLEELKRDLDNEERSFLTEHNQIQFKRKVLSPEELEEATRRLYDIPLSRQQQRIEEFNDEIQKGIDDSTNSHNQGIGKYLEASQQESVNRLYGWAAEREDRLLAKDESLWSEVPHPRISELEDEEREAIQARLATNTKPETLKQLELKFYGKPPPRKLSKKEQERLISSTYYSAVQKKAERLSKVESEHGDFRTKKKPSAKISTSQLKIMADRLSTRKA